MIKPQITPYSSSLSSRAFCAICYNPYDLDTFKPLLICTNDHSICKTCLISIKNTHRCPFCRQQVLLNRIRLNKLALDYIINHSKRGSQISIGSKGPHQHHLMERYTTEQTGRNQAEQPLPQFLNESEFMSQPQNHAEERVCSVWVVILYVYLLGLELGLGVINTYLGLSEPHHQCMDTHLQHTNLTLRYQWRNDGFFELLVAVMTLYFMISHYLRVLNLQQLRVFQSLLVFFSETINIISLIVYLKILPSESINFCSPLISKLITANIIVKGFQTLLGVYLLVKFYDQAFQT